MCIKHGANILNYAAVKGVKIKKLSKEEFALIMGQRLSNSAAATDAQIKLSEEELAKDSEHIAIQVLNLLNLDLNSN